MSSSGARLAALTKELWVQWQRTRETWSDSKSIEFERKYLQELYASVDKAVAVIADLDKVMAKIKSDCE